MQENKIVILICTLLFLVSCKRNTPQELTIPQYKDWISQNGEMLHKSKEIGDLVVKVQYNPTDFLVLRELPENTVFSKNAFDSVHKQKGDLQYYTIQIVSKSGQGDILMYGVSDDSEYIRRIDYLSFEAKNSFTIKQNGETLLPVLYHFERNYGLSPSVTFSCAFENGTTTLRTDRIFSFEDKVFGMGIVNFVFDMDDINGIPKVNTK